MASALWAARAHAGAQSDDAFLNGELLALDELGQLRASPIPGRAVAAGAGALVVPAFSFGFVELPLPLDVCQVAPRTRAREGRW